MACPGDTRLGSAVAADSRHHADRQRRVVGGTGSGGRGSAWQSRQGPASDGAVRQGSRGKACSGRLLRRGCPGSLGAAGWVSARRGRPGQGRFGAAVWAWLIWCGTFPQGRPLSAALGSLGMARFARIGSTRTARHGWRGSRGMARPRPDWFVAIVETWPGWQSGFVTSRQRRHGRATARLSRKVRDGEPGIGLVGAVRRGSRGMAAQGLPLAARSASRGSAVVVWKAMVGRGQARRWPGSRGDARYSGRSSSVARPGSLGRSRPGGSSRGPAARWCGQAVRDGLGKTGAARMARQSEQGSAWIAGLGSARFGMAVDARRGRLDESGYDRRGRAVVESQGRQAGRYVAAGEWQCKVRRRCVKVRWVRLSLVGWARQSRQFVATSVMVRLGSRGRDDRHGWARRRLGSHGQLWREWLGWQVRATAGQSRLSSARPGPSRHRITRRFSAAMASQVSAFRSSACHTKARPGSHGSG